MGNFVVAGKRIMLWDDMLRSAPMDVLNKFEYGLIRDHVELVVWQYSTKPAEHLPSDLLIRYRSSFRNGLWAATAFKVTSERPNLHFVGSAELMPNHDLSGRTDAEPMPNLIQ